MDLRLRVERAKGDRVKSAIRNLSTWLRVGPWARFETHLRACLNKAGAKIPVDRSAGAVVPICNIDFELNSVGIGCVHVAACEGEFVVGVVIGVDQR